MVRLVVVARRRSGGHQGGRVGGAAHSRAAFRQRCARMGGRSTAHGCLGSAACRPPCLCLGTASALRRRVGYASSDPEGSGRWRDKQLPLHADAAAGGSVSLGVQRARAHTPRPAQRVQRDAALQKYLHGQRTLGKACREKLRTPMAHRAAQRHGRGLVASGSLSLSPPTFSPLSIDISHKHSPWLVLNLLSVRVCVCMYHACTQPPFRACVCMYVSCM